MFDPARCYSFESVAQVLELEPGSVRELAQREGLEVLRFTPKTVRLRGDQLQDLVEKARLRAPDRRGAVARTVEPEAPRAA